MDEATELDVLRGLLAFGGAVGAWWIAGASALWVQRVVPRAVHATADAARDRALVARCWLDELTEYLHSTPAARPAAHLSSRTTGIHGGLR
ncbi:hypothetical protein [Streptomyces sp. NRRL F-5123]|uniref:hypothetical protein n=1 Tax=Streptomyces sp. NRRL F-5123 TaxID=1463856 RepID=UPI0004E241BE|nr:hypothetical protein [Streptomyces sp. NRRL F-5123]